MRKAWLALLGIGAAFVGSCVTIAPAQAEDSYNKELFGHRVRIFRKDDKDDMERLTIDGKTVVQNLYVSINDMYNIAGVDVLIGTSNDDTCDAFFVVSFPKNAAPRLDGPTRECSQVTYKVEGKALRFISGARGLKPRTWTWTPAKGMSAKVAAVIPNPFQNSDLWMDLRTGRVSYPIDLFKHPGMKAAIASLIGDDRKTVSDIADGQGSVRHEGELFVGTSCATGECGEREVMFVFDPTTTGIYVSWKPGANKPLVVRPAAEQWSPLARARLDEWLKKWEEIAAIAASPAASPTSQKPAPVDTSADDLLNDLRNKRLSKPEDIFKHPGMVIPIETLLSGYRETVMSMVRGGQGTVEDKGDVIVGSSCLADECSDKSLMFALDPTSKKVFFAWKTPGDPVVVKPSVKEWSQPARAELSVWSKRWTAAYASGGTSAASAFHPKINGSAEEAFGHKIQLSDSRLIITARLSSKV